MRLMQSVIEEQRFPAIRLRVFLDHLDDIFAVSPVLRPHVYCLADLVTAADWKFTPVSSEGEEKYLSCDVALLGSDKLVICVWNGLIVEEIVTKDKTSADNVEKLIRNLADKHNVPRKNIIIDSDGVGQYLSHYMSGVTAFVNNSKPLNKENYQNLKTQCYYKLAEQVNVGNIWVKCNDTDLRNKIIEEFEVIRRKNMDNDNKLAIISKKEMKSVLGHSPDFADALMMRMRYLFGNDKRILAWR